MAPVTTANVQQPCASDPDGTLAQCLALLMAADRAIAALPDDDPAGAAIIARVDMLLKQVAVLRPRTDRGFAVKARIARVYGDCEAGETVYRWLLTDLMIGDGRELNRGENLE